MHLFRMLGAWGEVESRVYNLVIAPALEEIYRQRLDGVLTGGALRPGNRLLDVGCGRGHVLALLRERFPRVSLFGIDLSRDMVRRARRRSSADVSIHRGDSRHLPYRSEAFDVVISLASIKHWPDQAGGVREMHRVLKPGGRILLLEADRLSSRRASREFVRRWRFMTPLARPLLTEWFMRFVAAQGVTAGALGSLLAGAGFAEVSARSLDDMPAALAHGTRPPAP